MAVMNILSGDNVKFDTTDDILDDLEEAVGTYPQTTLVAYATAQPGVTYTAITDFSNYTPAEINEISKAISNCSDITSNTETVYLSNAKKISVGATWNSTTETGTFYPMRIIGFNHNNLTTPTAYGEATATGKAGIAWQMQGVSTTYMASSVITNASNKGYGSNTNGILTDDYSYYTALPTLISNIVKQVGVTATYTTGSTATLNVYGVSGHVYTYSPSAVETGGIPSVQAKYQSYYNNEGVRYKYYSLGNTRALSAQYYTRSIVQCGSIYAIRLNYSIIGTTGFASGLNGTGNNTIAAPFRWIFNT